MKTIRVALPVLWTLSHWAGSGDLGVGMVALRGEAVWSHTDPLGHGPLKYQVGLGVLLSGSLQDNPRDPVKEPERPQDHCLPAFAGGQHFFEYLLVVSLKKKSSGPDYEPTITYQFPKVRMEGGRQGEAGFGCLRGSGGRDALFPTPPCQGLSLEPPYARCSHFLQAQPRFLLSPTESRSGFFVRN